MRAGKSTIGKLLAEQLNLPQYAIDENRWDYYEEIGYDNEVAAQIVSEQGMAGLLRYWKPYEAHTVERVLAEPTRCVTDFGAGHSVYEDANLFARVQAVLAPYPNVILILPSPDLDESVKIVNERFVQLLDNEGIDIDPELLKVNEHFVKHSSNHTLAKLTIYTNGKTPAETCNEILQKLAQ